MWAVLFLHFFSPCVFSVCATVFLFCWLTALQMVNHLLVPPCLIFISRQINTTSTGCASKTTVEPTPSWEQWPRWLTLLQYQESCVCARLSVFKYQLRYRRSERRSDISAYLNDFMWLCCGARNSQKLYNVNVAEVLLIQVFYLIFALPV